MKRFLTLSSLASLVLVAFAGLAPVASAHCTVNTGTCYGHCTINTGYCGTNGSCTVNTGSCFSVAALVCRLINSAQCEVDIIHADVPAAERAIEYLA